MNSYLGVVNKKPAVANDRDNQCFSESARKFPLAFSNARKTSGIQMQITGDYEVSDPGSGQGQLFFWGAIFNKAELLMLAGAGNRVFASNADLLHFLFSQKGVEAVKKVNGQFTIVYCRGNKISLINDHLGVEQLLYYQDDDRLVFGSRVSYLQCHPDCPKGIDWEAALRRPLPHMVLASYKGYDTWFKGIRLLPDASILEIDLESGTSAIRNYWKSQDVVPQEGDSRSASDVMGEYAALLEDAVKIRMNDCGVTYSLLSGGLDSSAICGLAVKNGPLETFSIINQTTVLEDTTAFCHRMAEELAFKNKQFLVPYHELCYSTQLWKQRVWRAESPVNHTDSLTKTMLHYAIRKNDPAVRAVLSGTGSDQMNGGLVGYVAAVADTPEESWSNFYNEIIDVENRKLISRAEESLWSIRKLVQRPFLSAISGVNTEANPWMICVDGALHSQAYSLIWDEQRASSSHGHATWYPFMDYRIAEFIAAVPANLHKELFYDKQILREPSKEFVPEYIVNKPKMPYNLPEYDNRIQVYEFLTAEREDSLFVEAFGDIETPHPVIDKKQLYTRIQALREKPEIMEWQSIIHILNLGILDKLHEQSEASMDYESILGTPPEINFDDPAEARVLLGKRLSIMTTDEMIDRPVKFGENCSLLLDIKSNKYYLSKRNNLTYEIEDECRAWKRFLMKIDNKLSAREILQEEGIAYSEIEQFFSLTLKEQILVITEKSTGY